MGEGEARDGAGSNPDELSALRQEVTALRGRVAELQRRSAAFASDLAAEPSPLGASASEREQLLLEAERIAHVGSWVWDVERNQVQWSDELFRILGYDPEHDEASYDGFFAAVHPEDRERVAAVSARGVQSGIAERVDCRVLRASGEVRHVSMQGAMLFDAGGRLRRIVGTVQDVTESLQMRERLAEAYKMEAIGRLAGGIAHDFNNLLTVILGNLDLLSHDSPSGSSEVMDALRAAESAQSLTSRLLAFSRRARLSRRPISPNELVEQTLALLKPLLGPQIELCTELDPNVPPIVVDRVQIEQALLNLVVNARDAQPNGGRVTLHTTTCSAGSGGGEMVVLRVSDAGAGMDEATRRQVFEPFFTTKAEGRGTGLGLATVLGTVEQHGGRVELESEPGKGTDVRLLFPPASSELVRNGPTESTSEDDAPPARAHSVLLIEDEELVARFVTRTLARRGDRVIWARTPSQARELYQTQRIDVVVCDVLMPEMRGPDLMRELAVERESPPPTLFISGFSDPEAGVPPGTTLSKPFTRAELEAALDRTLARQDRSPPRLVEARSPRSGSRE